MRLSLSRCALALALVVPCVARAAGPILIEPVNGQPVKWDRAQPVRYNLESGRLNASLSNSQGGAAVDSAFQTWTSLPGVSLRATRGATITADITEANVAEFLGKTDGLTPIVFDDTGRITDLVLGDGASQVVLGFATPEIIQGGTSTIIEGFACMNGKAMEGESSESILNLMVHELGHMLGLGHSQLNGDVIFDGNAANNATIPIMYPILRSSSPDNLTLAPTPTLDDEVSMGYLYPSSTYTARGGSISGRVLRGTQEFRGANVIVRRSGDPRTSAVSWPSGVASLGGAAWESHLLPAGSYSVEVEPIDPDFTGGSSLGSFDPPPTGIPVEFFSAPNEGSDPVVDDPRNQTLVAVAEGQSVTGVDILLNDSTVTINPGAEDSGSLKKSGTVYETNGALPSFQYTVPIGTATASLSIALEQTNGQPIDVYVRSGEAVAPGAIDGTFTSDASVTGTGSNKTLLLARGTTPTLRTGTYFIALVNRGAAPASYNLTASFTSPLSAGEATGGGGGGGCAARTGGTSVPGDAVDALLMLLPLAVVLVRRGRYARGGACGDAR